MNERRSQTIEEFLQGKDVQSRIQQRIHVARSEATVTIGSVAKLFGFSENQLRDWEKRGWLNPQRPVKPILPEQEGKNINRHRQYSLSELNKLAIIRELLDAEYTPGEITQNLDHIWKSIDALDEQLDSLLRTNGKRPEGKQSLPSQFSQEDAAYRYEGEHLDIDQYAYIAYKDLFWRYYASQALRLSAMLICESLPPVAAGLVLPKKQMPVSISRPDELSVVGESLVGWLGQTRSFYTLLTDSPTFEYPSDYRIFPLKAIEEDTPKDGTWIIVEREAAKHLILKKEGTDCLNLNTAIVESIRRLLAPIYEDVRDWRRYFGPGMRDLVLPASDFESGLIFSDIIFTGLANMVVRLGGKIAGDQNRWHFCAILLPNNPSLPMQQQRLVVRAQSKEAPYTLGETGVSPERSVISLSLRAFQSGHIIYRSEISVEDAAIAHRDLEGEIHSAIAVPIEGEDGSAVAVIYITSFKPKAFSEDDQRMLRMVGRMIEELLMTYRTRRQITMKLRKLIEKPQVTDILFEEFNSENSFINDVDNMLTRIQEQMPEKNTEVGKRVVSFISIDIDNQSGLASMYGNLVTRNLSWTLGRRILSLLRVLFTKQTDWRFYYIYADRFYLFLDGTPLDQAREKAERLQEALNGDYKVDALRTSVEQATKPDNMLKLEKITVRLGVTSYEYWKLAELLRRYSDATPIASVRSLIARFLDIALAMGKNEGGNVIIAWNPEVWGLARWSSKESIKQIDRVKD